MPRLPPLGLLATSLSCLAACSPGVKTTAATTTSSGKVEHVVVIAMENHDPGAIVGNTKDAPYINGELLAKYASSSGFVDTLPLGTPSEPHYILMEAGTARFADTTFTNDAIPSATNSTASTEHLASQLDAAGLSWIAYQEGLDPSTTGACPIRAAGFYAPKHDPFVFFQDVSGSPPAIDTAQCVEHHADLSAFFDRVASGAPLPAYSFVTPNQCHDMHGQAGCPNANLVNAGDQWLAEQLPPVIAYAREHHTAIFIVWDEGEQTLTIPFIAIGPGVRPGAVSDVRLTHGSLVRTVERIFGLPVLPAVSGENDFGSLFVDGLTP